MKIIVRPKYIFLVVLFALLAAYALYQARFLILGPQVWITYPKDGELVTDPLITIEGQAKNISWISLNGRQIFTDENGYWSEKLIVSSGTSIMTVSVRDRFGREKARSVEIILPTTPKEAEPTDFN